MGLGANKLKFYVVLTLDYKFLYRYLIKETPLRKNIILYFYNNIKEKLF